jgi:hypothetical protein
MLGAHTPSGPCCQVLHTGNIFQVALTTTAKNQIVLFFYYLFHFNVFSEKGNLWRKTHRLREPAYSVWMGPARHPQEFL